MVKSNPVHMINEATASSQTEVPSSAQKRPTKELQPLGGNDWLWPLAFMLSMAMVGLKFPLGYLLAPLIMFARFKSDRYDFLMMFTIFFGGYGLGHLTSWGIHSQWIILVIGMLGFVVLKKYSLLNRSMLLWALYAAALIIISTYSIVSFRIQLPKIVRYLTIIYFIIPLLIFAGREFDIKRFWYRVMPYIIIMSVFYIIDSLIISGNILVPKTHLFEDAQSTFWDPYMRPLSFRLHRKYPPGLYLMTLAIIPVVRVYRLRAWQWIVIIGGMLVTFTFTFISGILAAYIMFQGNIKHLLKYSWIGIITLGALYYVDSKLPVKSYETTTYAKPQSTLRIKSSIDQIIDLFNVQDEQDLAVLGTGRMAQAIPKLELLYNEDKEWVGFGFLDALINTPSRYIIYNDMYFEEYSEKNWEVANDIEIMPLEVLCTIGYIGLAIHILYFLFMWLTVRKCRNVNYFLCVMILFIWFGLSGFEGLARPQGLYLVGLAYGIVLLTNRPWTLNARTRIQDSPANNVEDSR